MNGLIRSCEEDRKTLKGASNNVCVLLQLQNFEKSQKTVPKGPPDAKSQCLIGSGGVFFYHTHNIQTYYLIGTYALILSH